MIRRHHLNNDNTTPDDNARVNGDMIVQHLTTPRHTTRDSNAAGRRLKAPPAGARSTGGGWHTDTRGAGEVEVHGTGCVCVCVCACVCARACMGCTCRQITQ
eukprot:NODE_2826_length_735_cov_260.240525_g1990_i0.p1 GENE.NODE_2826_length_735_cov_260.240525_g1990_i0~~NODE_2826_length_735_cov_260.240525_g1990_i0.p1  ORF type:complete len:102 (+),score=3.25 NODE_2826_length_735_cov_260.240525_g1990_i0:280-585(+)